RLVEAGVRSEIGQVEEALRLLKNEIEELGTRGTKVARARLRYGYADLLERTGEGEQAERWFDAVIRLDPEDSTDAADRVAALRGMVIEYDETEDDFEESEEASEADESVDLDPAPEEVVAAEGTGNPEETAEAAIDPMDAVALDETDLDQTGETTEQ
ncbi:MAG: tetratricopeptide repeat protein, partial [Propionibacteriaceae bacterium]|nr:tetratricopeptide repeat protein [Propionibacteriaceae bacterium]